MVGEIKHSFVVGYGTRSPEHINEAASSCPRSASAACTSDAEFAEGPNPWTLRGALVRGPYSNDILVDSRTSTQTYVQVGPAVGGWGKIRGACSRGGFQGVLPDLGTCPLWIMLHGNLWVMLHGKGCRRGGDSCRLHTAERDCHLPASMQSHCLVSWHFMGIRSQSDCNMRQRVVLHVSCQSQLHVGCSSNVNTPAA